MLRILDAKLDFGGLARPVEPELPGGFESIAPPPELRDAAVLIPIVMRAAGFNFILTRRPDHFTSHAGQVAFPGGRIDPTDAGPVEAALREAEEEIGLPPLFVDVRGVMEPFATGTGFKIYPVVGLVEPKFQVKLNVEEVAEAFEVPFDFLMDPKNHHVKVGEFRGQQRRYYEMIYGGQRIWGATAHIIVKLYGRLFEAS
jgi:8-oxo-dGTP pyrophosphatase MutT (NUDIX family)